MTIDELKSGFLSRGYEVISKQDNIVYMLIPIKDPHCLWGSFENKEAYRYLNYGGIMYIAEPKDKINQEELIGGAMHIGFKIISIDGERNGKTYIEFKKV